MAKGKKNVLDGCYLLQAMLLFLYQSQLGGVLGSGFRQRREETCELATGDCSSPVWMRPGKIWNLGLIDQGKLRPGSVTAE